MSYPESTGDLPHADTAPGDQRLEAGEFAEGVSSYLIGLALAVLLTIASFFISGTTLVWGPSIPVALAVLAIAQMGVHLVFFLHITTGPDNVNNVLALAFGVLIVLLLLAGSLWIMANLNRNMAPMDQSVHMRFESGSTGRAVTANGVVSPPPTASVAARVSGVIQGVYCDADAPVKAGQICAKIDPRAYQTTVEQSRAELAAAEAQLKRDEADLALAQSAMESPKAQAKHGAAGRKAADKARKAIEKMQAQTKRDETKVAELRGALRAAEANLDDTDVVSPIDGRVVSRNVEVGQTVAGKREAPPLFVIASGRTANLDASVGAKDIGGIKTGDKATFTVEALTNRRFSGEVTEIRPSPRTDEPIATYDVLISAPDPDLLLKPGMAARIRIEME